MFVTKAKYEKLARQLFNLMVRAEAVADLLEAERRANALLLAELRAKQTNGQFTKDEIKRLIALCHPDKHGNSKIATEMTQKLLAMR